MKKGLFLVCMLIILTSIQAYSQAGQAMLTKSGAVALSNEEPLKSHYTLNAENFIFESDQEAIDYFSALSSNHVVYRMNRSNGIVNIYLQLKKEPDWTLQDWNAYLSEHKALDINAQHQTSK